MKHLVIIGILVLSSCGTFSHMKPADPTEPGKVDLAVGLAVNGLGEGLPVVQGSVGVTSFLDLGGKYEVYNSYGWVRLIPFNSEDHGFALALIGGYGAMNSFSQIIGQRFTEARFEGSIAVVGATLGKRFGTLDLYAGYRAYLSLNNAPIPVQSAKGGGRLMLGKRFYLGLEAGASFHTEVVIFEATGSLGFIIF